MTQVFFIMLKLSRKRQNHIKKTRKLSKIYKEDILKTNILLFSRYIFKKI